MLPAPTQDTIRPMQAPEQTVPAFTDAAWLYQIKFDGYRTPASFGDGAVARRTKSGADCTRWYPEVVDALALLSGGPHVIDAEACVLDDLGRGDFDRLHPRAARRGWVKGCDQVTLMVFDLLVHNGASVMNLPLIGRKALLADLLRGVPKAALLVVSELPAEASLFDQFVMGLQLEGFMAKRRASTYQPGV